MSPPQQDPTRPGKSRQRANTTSFSSFGWRRNKSDYSTSPPVNASPSNQQSLSLEALLEALKPPAVPSLAHARALASLLSTTSPLPRRAVLSPILSSLCDVHGPLAFQAAGFDILSSYWENPEAIGVETSDRLSFFSLFLGSNIPWAMELWEPRFKALRTLTRYGADIVGIEISLLNVVKQWVEGAFDGLLKNGSDLDLSERMERERSLDVLVKFLSDILKRPDNIARLPEDTISSMISFYANLVDRSIVGLTKSLGMEDLPTTSSESLVIPVQSKSISGHRRNLSSLSTSSLISPSPTVTSFQPQNAHKPPAEIAIMIYLGYLQTQIKTLSPPLLNDILSLLFRALASCVCPLSRLTVLPHSRKKFPLEERLLEVLNSLYTGPYSTSCMLIQNQYLFPRFSEEEQIEEETIYPQPEDIETLRAAQTKIPWEPLRLGILTSLGAHRMLRNHVRRALTSRLARAYILRESSLGYAYSGAPSHIDVEQDLMEKAWPKEDYVTNAGIGIGTSTGWDARRIGRALASSVAEWVSWVGEGPHTYNVTQPDQSELKDSWDRERQDVDRILDEVAGLLRDILQEAKSREEGPILEDEEAIVVGETLYNLAAYVLSLRNPDGSPFIIPLNDPANAPTPLLRSISSLLAGNHINNLKPLLSTTLISIADHLSDEDTAKLPALMLEQHDLSPTSPDWLKNWEVLFKNPTVTASQRPLTRRAIMDVLDMVFESVKDMEGYRRPVADIVLDFCGKGVATPDIESENGDVLWGIIGDELVLRAVEASKNEEQGMHDVQKMMDLLVTVASEPMNEGDEEEIVNVPTDIQSPSSMTINSTPSSAVSPVLSRMQSETPVSGKERERESTLPSVMSSILSSFTAGVSRSHSTQVQAIEEAVELSRAPTPLSSMSLPRCVCAVSAIINAFSQLAFSPLVLQEEHLKLSMRLYQALLDILEKGQSARARVTVLQFLMRLRGDRNHNVYYIERRCDIDGLTGMLAGLINRSSIPPTDRDIEDVDDNLNEFRRTRQRISQEGEEHTSKPQATGSTPKAASSRSRSRAPVQVPPAVSAKKNPPKSLWEYPETFPFAVEGVDCPSEGLVSYDSNPESNAMLPISRYLTVIMCILEKEKNWEVLSYVLCHLPDQLANKHLFCCPQSRQVISKLLGILCTGIVNADLGSHIEAWPSGVKMRDAQGLSYHTLSVLISYRKYFDLHQRHLLVEVFHQGLDGQRSTIKCCVHALTLSAFDLQSSVTKFMPKILEKLSQIMSNPNMAVHILAFLSIVGSTPALYANFTEADYKMVFGVALQYLQHYNRLNASPTVSWALSQYVRIMSYFTVYIWFLALKMPDRPKHMPYITRQLMLANEGNEALDGPTEVCFDWLARFAYASADPRPATSSFSEVIMNPASHSPESGPSEVMHPVKTWIVGNAVVTVRTLPRLGWVEVLSRRPSGFSKFICRVENVPMVGPGDVAPDISSLPAGLILDRNPTKVLSATGELITEIREFGEQEELQQALAVEKNDDVPEPPKPDPITGYIWSKTAPSQRRKDVLVDPSYFVFQLSSYPKGNSHIQKVENCSTLDRFLANLDRIPVIDTHKVGIMYVAPGQSDERDILKNTHGSPAYTRFLEGLGRLINLRGQVDVYAGGLDPDEDGEYAYAWWDDIGQILYHTATLMPSHPHDPDFNFKKRHIGNDYVRIIWNDSGLPYRFDTLTTQFQFVNIVIEPHSLGAIAAFSVVHENEYFKVTVQRAPGMTEFAPVGNFKLISAENLPLLIRHLSLLADWFVFVFAQTQNDTVRVETKTNWYARLEAIRRFQNQLPSTEQFESEGGIFNQESLRDFTNRF